MMTSIVLQRQRSSWPPTPCKQSTVITTRMSTHQATCPVNNCSLRGETAFVTHLPLQVHICLSVHQLDSLISVILECWTNTNSTRTSGRRGFRCGMKNTRAWWGNNFTANDISKNKDKPGLLPWVALHGNLGLFACVLRQEKCRTTSVSQCFY